MFHNSSCLQRNQRSQRPVTTTRPSRGSLDQFLSSEHSEVPIHCYANLEKPLGINRIWEGQLKQYMPHHETPVFHGAPVKCGSTRGAQRIDD